MAEELLDGANVVAIFEQLGGKRVTKRMAARPLGEARLAYGGPDGALDDGLMKVVTAAGTGPPV